MVLGRLRAFLLPNFIPAGFNFNDFNAPVRDAEKRVAPPMLNVLPISSR